MKKLTFLPVLLCLFIATIGFSKDWDHAQKIDDYFEILSPEKTDFEPMGTVCERVAFKEVEAIYPTNVYEIKSGLQYDEKKATIGELDLVIFNRETKMAEAIAEVKCWRSFEGALKKAREQRARFMTYRNHNIVIYDDANVKYAKERFNDVKKFFTISQFGGIEHGFDMELPLDFKELMELRNRLLDCKAEGHCPKE